MYQHQKLSQTMTNWTLMPSSRSILVLKCTKEVLEVTICAYKWHSQLLCTPSHKEPPIFHCPHLCNYMVTKLDYPSPSICVEVATSVCSACHPSLRMPCYESLTRASALCLTKKRRSKIVEVTSGRQCRGDDGGRKAKKEMATLDFNSESWRVIVMWWIVSS